MDLNNAINLFDITAIVAAFGGADLSYDVYNNGTLDAANVGVDFSIPANVTLGAVTPESGTCTTGTGTVSCTLGDIPGSGSRSVGITVTPNALGAGTISAWANALPGRLKG